jgi:mycothiol synthase
MNKKFLMTHPENLEEIYDFGIDCDIAEFGEPDSSLEDLKRLWEGIDPSQDAWITRGEDGRLTGFANISRENARLHVDIYMHLKRTPHGVENALLQAAVERGKTIALSEEFLKIVGYSTGGNRRLQEAYENAGFKVFTYHYRMQIDFDAPFTPVVWLPEYTVNEYEPEDEQELYELIQAAFSWEGRDKIDIDFWRSLLFRNGNYDPRYFVLVRREGRLVGCALGYMEEQGGWIRQLAVAKEMQGKGLGGMLLRHMFDLFSQVGARNTALGVASKNENAVKFYERNGMRRVREFLEYKLELQEAIQ